jgi:hypothetical protein
VRVGLQRVLFVVSLVLLPLAEWRILYLPINGRVFGVDLTGYRSVSLFDVVFFGLAVLTVPDAWRWLRERRWQRWALAFWAPAVLLIPTLFLYLRPRLPYLTPRFDVVIDTRSFIVHFAVAVVVTVYLSRVPPARIARGAFVFYSATVALFLVLCVLALLEFPYFVTHYPFTTPFTIAFPFPNQNVAAPFISVSVLGLLGTAAVLRGRAWAVVLVGVPVLIAAAGLTGSRSNMLVLLVALFGFIGGWSLQAATVTRKMVGVRPAFVVATSSAAVGVLVLLHSWAPVQRSLSMLGEIARDPAIVLAAQEGSPRRQLWSLALRGGAIEPDVPRDDERYAITLLSVENGCRTISPPIDGLRVGLPYFVRLERGDGEARLTVFSDARRTQVVGRRTIPGPPAATPYLRLFVADTGRDRVILSGWIADYRLRTPGRASESLLEDPQQLRWHEEWYRPGYGQEMGVIRAGRGRLDIVAWEKAVRGYVARRQPLAAAEHAILEYAVGIDRASMILPLVPPARFYVGFHDTEAGPDDAWASLRNAVLVAHVRQPVAREAGALASVITQRQAVEAKTMAAAGASDAAIAERFARLATCGDAGRSDLQTTALWWPPPVRVPGGKGAQPSAAFGPGEAAALRGYAFGGAVRSDSADPISVRADPTWSAAAHLAGRGSTHNVYLDWLYYVGRVPFALFVLFMVGMVVAAVAAARRCRASSVFPLYLATALQIVVVAASMYAHPGIWLKYFWFLFGVAGALMLHRDDSPRPHAGEAPTSR